MTRSRLLAWEVGDWDLSRMSEGKGLVSRLVGVPWYPRPCSLGIGLLSLDACEAVDVLNVDRLTGKVSAKKLSEGMVVIS